MQFTFSSFRELMHYTLKVIFPSIRVNENSVEYKQPVCESPAQVINNKWQKIPVYNCNNLQRPKKTPFLASLQKEQEKYSFPFCRRRHCLAGTLFSLFSCNPQTKKKSTTAFQWICNEALNGKGLFKEGLQQQCGVRFTLFLDCRIFYKYLALEKKHVLLVSSSYSMQIKSQKMQTLPNHLNKYEKGSEVYLHFTNDRMLNLKL